MEENMNTDKPTFVYRDGMMANREYVEWLSEIKQRLHQNQIKGEQLQVSGCCKVYNGIYLYPFCRNA